jgi:hypothetical protein
MVEGNSTHANGHRPIVKKKTDPGNMGNSESKLE